MSENSSNNSNENNNNNVEQRQRRREQRQQQQRQQRSTSSLQEPIPIAPAAAVTGNSESPLAPIDAKTRQRLAKIDGPFRPYDGPFDSNQAAWSLTLPESIYSTVFMLPLAVDKTMWCDVSNILTIFVCQFFLYLVLVSTQALSCYYLYRETFVSSGLLIEEGEETSFEYTSVCTSPTWSIIRCFGLTITFLFILTYTNDTFTMYRWISAVPNWHGGHQEITDYCCRYSGRTSLPFQKYADDYGVTVQKPAVGFTIYFRILLFVFILLPRFLFGLFVMIYGTGYVASAQQQSSSYFESIMIRVMTIVIVLYLDKLLYKVLTPNVYQMWTCKNFVITFSEEEDNEIMRWLPFLTVLFVAGGVYATNTVWCSYANYLFLSPTLFPEFLNLE